MDFSKELEAKVTSINERNKLGADVNQDGKITAGDYVKVKNYIMKTGTIGI